MTPDDRSDPQKNDNVGPDPATTAQGPLPSVSLPKGGGAIRGIGEKFAANPVNGTGSTSVPIATSPAPSAHPPRP